MCTVSCVTGTLGSLQGTKVGSFCHSLCGEHPLCSRHCFRCWNENQWMKKLSEWKPEEIVHNTNAEIIQMRDEGSTDLSGNSIRSPSETRGAPGRSSNGSPHVLGFPGGSDVKESACSAGDLGSIPESGRSSGERKGNRLQYSCLGNPMNRGAWWAVHGPQRVRHNWTCTHSTFLY